MNALTSTPALVLLLLVTLLGGTALDSDSQFAVEGEPARAALDAEVEARKQHAAREVCAQEMGVGSVHRWTPQGELVCMAPLGMPIAQGGQQ